jgi:hypothetical protein
MNSLIQIIQEWYGLGLLFLAVVLNLGMTLSIQILLDLAWLAILSVANALAMMYLWPIIIRINRRPEHTLLDTALGMGIVGLLFTILDWLLLAYDRVSRIKGYLLPITSAVAILWAFAIPVILMAVIYIGFRWVSGKINRILDKKKSVDMIRTLKATAAPTDEVCGICMDDFAKPMALPCRHVFCNDCIRLALNKRPACPICGRM